MFEIKMDAVPNHEFAKILLEERMEKGIRINPEINKVRAELRKSYEITLENMNLIHGVQNPNSSQQVKDAFNQVLRYEHKPLTFEGTKQTFKKEILQRLVGLGYDIASDMIQYRRFKKLLESVDSLLNRMDSNGLLHPSVSTGKTNRFNYSDPALMNIPKVLLWKAIAPYNENTTLYSVDIKQQEPWIIVNMLEIQQLKDLLAKHGDFYKAMYIAIFNEDFTNVRQRAEIKTAWNAMAYGASPETVKNYCKNLDGERVYKYFSSIPEYKTFRGRAFGLAKKRVQKVKTLFGTELYAAEFNQGALARVLMDIPIQGTGTDILVLLMGHFMDSIDEDGLVDDLDIYYTRHDELIIEASKDLPEEMVVNYLREHLEHGIEGWEPFRVEINKVVDLAESTSIEDDPDELED